MTQDAPAAKASWFGAGAAYARTSAKPAAASAGQASATASAVNLFMTPHMRRCGSAACSWQA